MKKTDKIYFINICILVEVICEFSAPYFFLNSLSLPDHLYKDLQVFICGKSD